MSHRYSTFKPNTYEHEISFFFFFQAEDGIRDVAVTGVQTCALPIYRVTLKGEFANWSWKRHTAVVLEGDRKSVVWGKGVDLGGRRIIKKKKKVNKNGWRA